MAVLTLTPTQFADLMRSEEMVLLPVSIAGFVYGVIRGAKDQNIYRVAVA